MKKISYIILFMSLVIIFFACKKESYVSDFNKSPQERAADQIDSVKNMLTSEENGWIATLPTGLGGGYGFYMTFDREGFVDMYADLTDATSETSKKSQYRVKQDMGTDLSFDTYTYITWLNNPEVSAFGGRIREGFRSDIDFIYDRHTSDTIIFIGKRYRQKFSLVRATAVQKAQYTNGGYKVFINRVKDFFQNNPNAYIELGALKASVELNAGNDLESGKRITMSALFPGDSIAAVISKYAFTIDNVSILDSGITINNITFNKADWKNANDLALYDLSGKEYLVKNNPTPLLPLYMLWGTKYSGMYGGYQIYPGTSTSGADILNYHYRNTGNAYSFNYLSLDFDWNIINKRLTLNGFSSQNGGTSGWTTTVVYNYTVDNQGIYTFTLRSDFSGGYVRNSMQRIHQFMLNNRIKFDYYTVNGEVLAKMESVDNPGIIMTFELYQ